MSSLNVSGITNIQGGILANNLPISIGSGTGGYPSTLPVWGLWIDSANNYVLKIRTPFN
jgi:hypothetical protein